MQARSTGRRLTALLTGMLVIFLNLGMYITPAAVTAASTSAATLDQCTNGGISPLSPEPCVGSNAAGVTVTIPGINSGTATSYKNWVNGNANGSKSHWREGEFIPYRAIVSGLTAGAHTIVMSYDVVHSGGHATDYLGSYDATETTATATTKLGSVIIHANNANACSDLVAAGEMAAADCVASAPISHLAVPAANIAGEQACGGSNGTFAGTQQAGDVKLYGPSGSSLTGFTYVSQNVVSGTGQCSTTFSVSFNTPAVDANHAVVLAWGGHIASSADWGAGNSASSISGSPYHMALLSLDNTSTGSQDRSLSTSALFFTPTIATVIKPATTVTAGTTVYDTATMSGADATAGGTVTYTWFANGTCSGTGTSAGTVTVSNGVVPNSNNEVPATAGNYSFLATYSGDANDLGATADCEPLVVTASPTLTTTIEDASNNAVTSVNAGETVHDTATLSGASSNAGGTVTYTFYSNGTCTGTGTSAGTATVTDGVVGNSSDEGPLASGSYSFKAVYSGDTLNAGAIGDCEPLSVLTASVHVTKTADAASVSAGSSIGFTVTVSNSGTGTVTGVSLTDALPGGNSGSPVHWVIDGTTGNPTAFSISGADGSQSLSLANQPISLAAGASLTVHVTAATSASSCATYDNTASVASTNDGTDQASASESVLCASVHIAKTADASSVNAGDAIGFTITVNNSGAGTAHGVTVSDPLPAGSGTGVTWSIDTQSDSGLCSISDNGGSQSLGCGPTDLAPGASFSVHITATTSAAECSTYDNTASVTTTNDGSDQSSASITCDAASVHILKTADAATVSAGDPIGFTVTVSNTGTGLAHGVTVNDPLPAGSGTGVTWAIDGAANGFSITGSAGSQDLVFGPADLAAGGSVSVHITASTSAAECSTYDNTASVTTTNDGSDQSSASITCQSPSLTITKTADAASVNAGDPIGFTIEVANGGPGTAKSVTLTDPLPAGVTWSVDGGTGEADCSISSGTLSCSFGDMASGASLTVHISAATSAAACSTYDNTATASASNAPSVQDSASITCNPASVHVLKTADASTANAGESIGFTLTVSNTGTGTAKNVSLTDTLPTNSGLTWSIDAAGTTAPNCSISAGVLTCSIGDLAGGASVDVHITSPTTSATCGTVDNTGSVSASNDGSDSSSASVTVNCPSVTVTKTADAGTVSAGDQIGFVITVSNAGPGTATNVSLSDTLPTNTGLDWSIDAGGTTAPDCSIASGVLTCAIGDLASGASVQVHLTSPTTSASCGTVDNTAVVTVGNGDGGSDSASVTVNCPDLTITKTADASTVNAGDSIGFVITVSNTGAGTAKSVSLTDTLPTNSGLDWSIDAAGTTAPNCSIASGVLTCSIGDLASGASVQVHITSPTTSATCGEVDNTGSVTATNVDGSPSASASITVNCASVTITKTADAGTVSAGDQIGFTITVTNSGAGTAYGVSMTDTLPTNGGLDWSIDTAGSDTGFSITAGTLSYGPASLAAGASVHVHITSPTTAATCGSVDNTATVTTTNDGGGSASASATVDCPSLAITKTADATPVNAGDPIGFTITVSNTGSGTAYGTTMSDPLPAGSGTGVTWSIDTQSDSGLCSVSGSAGSQTLSCGPTDLAAGGSFSVHVTASTSGSECSTYDNTATASATYASSVEASASITCNPLTQSQITPTQTTCSQFASGTAATLGMISYATKGSTISTVAPGVLFYWVKVSVASAGTQTFTINQSTTYAPTSGSPYFTVAAGSFAYNGACGTLPTTIGGTASATTVTFTASAAGTYYIGIKYAPKSVVGSGPASKVSGFAYTYTFSTAGLAGSAAQVLLQHK